MIFAAISWTAAADILGVFCLVLGSGFIFISAIGMLRYQDLLSRQHVATKPQVFSVIMFLLGVILLVRESAVTWTLLIVIVFQLVSSPISAHMLSRAGYRTGRVLAGELVVDELGVDLRTGTDRHHRGITPQAQPNRNNSAAASEISAVQKDLFQTELQEVQTFAKSDEFSSKPSERGT
ncbi:monovalent cation/H(+) antiporter subunit G [Arcanobacterium hippocoleae]